MATWEKLSAIECNCAIEATLDNCLAKVSNQVCTAILPYCDVGAAPSRTSWVRSTAAGLRSRH